MWPLQPIICQRRCCLLRTPNIKFNIIKIPNIKRYEDVELRRKFTVIGDRRLNPNSKYEITSENCDTNHNRISEGIVIWVL